jgi:hypothetical protein
MRNCLLIFLIIIFSLSLPSFFFFINIGQTITPAYIKKELKTSGMLDKISQNLPQDLAKAISEDGSVDQKAVNGFISHISNQEIKETLETNIDSNLAALSNPNSKELVFDLSKITGSLPAEFKQAMKESGEQELKDKYVYKIPPEIRIYRYTVNNLRLIEIYGVISIIVFLVLIALLARGWRTKFRAVSLSLLLPGIVIFFPFIIFRYLPIKLPDLTELPSIMYVIIQDLFNIVKIDISKLYILEGGILLASALIFFVISFFFKSDHPTPPELVAHQTAAAKP